MKSKRPSHRFGGAPRILEWLLSLILLVDVAIIARLTMPAKPLPIMLVLILFIVAAVLALGVKMKEEADLTV